VRLRYLYVGSSDAARDLAAWLALDGTYADTANEHAVRAGTEPDAAAARSDGPTPHTGDS
jgi:hypothetical protein